MTECDQSKAWERQEGDWVWCLNCERCYQVGEYKADNNLLELCPYLDCNGDTVVDSWLWNDIRENHPEYPEVPEKGKVYPLY